MPKRLKKPQKKTKTYYDYHECRNYLQKKYGYDERNYAGKKFSGDTDVPYQDFWHWLIDHHGIHNGCFVTFDRDTLKNEDTDWMGDWVKEIYTHYIEEFADENGELEMEVWW